MTYFLCWWSSKITLKKCAHVDLLIYSIYYTCFHHRFRKEMIMACSCQTKAYPNIMISGMNCVRKFKHYILKFFGVSSFDSFLFVSNKYFLVKSSKNNFRVEMDFSVSLFKDHFITKRIVKKINNNVIVIPVYQHAERKSHTIIFFYLDLSHCLVTSFEQSFAFLE